MSHFSPLPPSHGEPTNLNLALAIFFLFILAILVALYFTSRRATQVEGLGILSVFALGKPLQKSLSFHGLWYNRFQYVSSVYSCSLHCFERSLWVVP